MTTETKKYPAGMHPVLPPPSGSVGPVRWMRDNLRWSANPHKYEKPILEY